MITLGSSKQLLSSLSDLKKVARLAKGTIPVCENRGIKVSQYSDLKFFLLPVPLVALGLKLQFAINKVGKFITLKYIANEEAQQMYQSIRETANENNIATPIVDSLNEMISSNFNI